MELQGDWWVEDRKYIGYRCGEYLLIRILDFDNEKLTKFREISKQRVSTVFYDPHQHQLHPRT